MDQIFGLDIYVAIFSNLRHSYTSEHCNAIVREGRSSATKAVSVPGPRWMSNHSDQTICNNKDLPIYANHDDGRYFRSYASTSNRTSAIARHLELYIHGIRNFSALQFADFCNVMF